MKPFPVAKADLMEPQVEAVLRGSGQGLAMGRSSLMKGLEETSGLGVPGRQEEHPGEQSSMSQGGR